MTPTCNHVLPAEPEGSRSPREPAESPNEPYRDRLIVLLPNRHGRVTPHEFVRLEQRAAGIVPMYQCEVSGETRAYGLIRPDTTKRTLEALYGPLRLEYWPATIRSWVTRYDEDDDVESDVDVEDVAA